MKKIIIFLMISLPLFAQSKGGAGSSNQHHVYAISLNTATNPQHLFVIGSSAATKLNVFNFVDTDWNVNRTDPQKAADSTSVNLSFVKDNPLFTIMGKHGETLFQVDSTGFNAFSLPYAAASDTTDQITTAGTTADSIRFSHNDHLQQFAHTAGSASFTAQRAGKYLVTFSGVWVSSAPNKTFNVWGQINETNITRSNTVFQLLGTAQQRVVTVTFIISMTVGQRFRLMQWSDDNAGKLDYTAAQATPTRPECPSIILTINKISD